MSYSFLQSIEKEGFAMKKQSSELKKLIEAVKNCGVYNDNKAIAQAIAEKIGKEER